MTLPAPARAAHPRLRQRVLNEVVGTLPYMAPALTNISAERAEPDKIDKVSDEDDSDEEFGSLMSRIKSRRTAGKPNYIYIYCRRRKKLYLTS